MASSESGTLYGSYSHRYLSIDVVTHGDVESMRVIEELLKAGVNTATLLDPAMRQVVIFQELRHFHDLFGTSAGIYTFLNHMRRLEKFLLVCRKLYEDDVTFELPFPECVGRNDCPTYVKAFARRLDFDTSCRLVFEGMCEFPAQREKSDEAWREFLVPLGKQNALVPAFPMTFGFRRLGRQESEPGPIVQWVPLGLSILVEGNAQALQRLYLNSTLSEQLDRELEIAQRVPDAIDAGLDLFDVTSGLVSPYRVTDLVLSKYLKTRQPALARFPREWIMRLTDLALIMSHFDGFDEKPSFRSAGGMFVSYIEDTKWPSSAEGSPELPISFSRGQLTALKDDMLNCGPPEGVAEGTVFGPGEYIVSYARQKIIAPILELRIKYGNEFFSDLTLYVSKMPEFPTAPIMTVDGIAQEASGVPKEFYKWWGLFVTISEVAEQIWSGCCIFCCPRAYPAVAAIASFEFAGTPGCAAHLAEKRCGTWDAKRTEPLPNCYFKVPTRFLFAKRGTRKKTEKR